MAQISAINSTPVIASSKINDKQSKPQQTGYNVGHTLGLLAMPFVVGEGSAIKTFYKNKGQIEAYKNMLTKFAEGSAERQGIEDCLNIVKKNMQATKKGGLILLATMVACSAWVLIANACSKPKTNIENKSEAVKENTPTKVLTNA